MGKGRHRSDGILPASDVVIETKASPRVLHCAETIKGGIASYLRELIELQCRDFGAKNVAILIPASQSKELPLPGGVRVEVFNDSSGRTANAFKLAWGSFAVARRYRPTVVHVHSTFAGATVRPAMALGFRSARVIYCAHGWAWDRPMSQTAKKATKWVEKTLAHITSCVICISDHELRSAVDAGLDARRLRVVVNGIASTAPLPAAPPAQWPTGNIRVLFVGRFDRQKGVDLLVEALNELGPEASAILAGDAVLADSDGLVLPGNATTAGWVTPSQLEALYQSADVLVVPSRWEGFGLVAAEAMRAGLPVIATRVGGLPEVVADGETGILIEPGSAKGIRDAVRQLDRPLMKLFGNAGRQRFSERFTIDRVHRDLCLLYDCS